MKFSKEDIISADELRSNSAAGIDGFSAIYLKECKEALSVYFGKNATMKATFRYD